MPLALRVRYYAQLREALKTDSEEIAVETPISEPALLELLATRHPRQRAVLMASRVAVADGYVESSAALSGLEEGVDIISPISGG